MKVGILTFYFGRNYGALLQAYGLRKAIESLGHEVVVVHYIPQHFSGFMSPVETSLFRLGWRSYGPRLVVERRLRTYHFNRFKRNALRLTRRCKNKQDLIRLASEIDVLVVGSDQVWNLNNLDYKDFCYFLDFPKPQGSRYISYAACCGQKDQPLTLLATVSSFLAEFDSISVRNDFTAEFLKKLTNQTPAIVADPTLLIAYDDVEDGYVPISSYILVYVLEQKSINEYAKIISEVNDKLGLPVWSIADGNQMWQDKPFPGADKNWFGISPGRFLSLIKHASCVLTDSFHGTIFSIKYKRPFVALNDGGWRNMRMIDLANRYCIGHRFNSIYSVIDLALLLRADDLELVTKRFDDHKVLSYDFLQSSL